MAQKVLIELVDDIDGTPAAETLSFGFDGRTYEIDLNQKNADKLRKSLAAYLEHGRRMGSAPVRRAKSSDAKAIREWAATQGMEVSPRGQIPKDVRDAYAAAR